MSSFSQRFLAFTFSHHALAEGVWHDEQPRQVQDYLQQNPQRPFPKL